MAITITHPFVSAKSDGTDASLIQPSNWNDNHSVIGTVDVANGGTGATTASAARTNLGLGTIATQNANNVSITGGSMSGVTLTSLDASTTFQDNADPTKQMQFQLSSITGGQTSVLTVPDADGAIVLDTATQTLTNKTLTSPTINGGSITGITDLALADGGTGASLADPNADRIMFWDDSAGAVTWLTAGTGLAITDTTIAATNNGDVVGPASATDNAIARFDGTTGKLIQNSAVTVADTTGDLTGGAYNGLTVSTGTNTVTLTRGTAALTWNTSGTLGSAAFTASTDYAVAAKGVTNGDSHDHSGGDGAQIAYANLSGLPTLGTIASQAANNVSITGGSITGITDLALADGGTGASLTDPNADRIMFWDDSAGAVTWLTAGTGLSITDTTISATSTGDVVGPASATDNAIARFDGTTGKLIQNSAVTVADTTGDIVGGTYNGLTVSTGTNTATLTRGTAALTWNTSGTLGSAAFTASTAYATAAQGVTNGDSHDHSGGDGAQIAYSSLSGLPTLGTIASQAANNVNITGGSITGITDLALADGGTGASLTDPNADRIMFWDDSAGAVTWLTAGTGLSISGTTLSTTDLGGDVVGPASATDNAIVRFDGTTGKLVQNSAVTIADTTGDLTGGKYNKVTITAPATGATLTIADNKTLTVSNTLTFTGTDSSSVAFGAGGTAQLAGKQTIWVPAGAMTSRTTNGAAAGTVETTTNKVMLKTLDFDTATQEFAQFSILMPKGWNESTVTFKAAWSHAATTVNFGVAWQIQGLALSDDDAADAAFGTAIAVTDTGGTTNDLYLTAESSAVTIGGTPAEGDWVVFQVARVPANGSDTMAIDARLHGIHLYYTTNAANDA